MRFDAISRRSLLKSSAAAAAGLSLPLGGLFGPGFGRARAADGSPLFFLLVSVPEGMDSSYLFDGRPLALTAAGLKANYLNEDPTPWTGSNGGVALATRLTAPLKPYKDDFSVLNGVVMAATFDGHDQNTNFLLTGNPFGGESFIPHLNAGAARAPLDYVQTGLLFSNITNAGASMPLTSATARSLVAKLNAASPIDAQDPVAQAVARRYAANAAGSGRFSKASGLMRDAFGSAPALATMLKQLKLPPAPATGDAGIFGENFPDELAVVAEFFRSGATHSAVVTVRPDFKLGFTDAHDAEDAKKSGAFIGAIAAQIAQVFAVLKATTLDGKKSLFDQTVVVVTSEFSRTMRKLDAPIDDTGTDHNPLTNSVLIGGGGIRGGFVLGESDTQTAGEQISGAHRTLDKDHLKIMGRPFDFAAMRPSGANPAAYQAGDYLSFASVANTIYKRFGLGEERLWTLERNGPKAKTLDVLLG